MNEQRPDQGESLSHRIITILADTPAHPVTYKKLRHEIARRFQNIPDGAIRSALDEATANGHILTVARETYFLEHSLRQICERICRILADFHALHPYLPGLKARELRDKLGTGKTRGSGRAIDPEIFALAMARCREEGRIAPGKTGLRLRGFRSSLGSSQQEKEIRRATLSFVEEHAFQRLDRERLASHLGTVVLKSEVVIARMVEDREIIPYGPDRFLSRARWNHTLELVDEEMRQQGSMTTGELKSFLGIPRSALIPLLTKFDSLGLTRRDGDLRQPGSEASRVQLLID